MATILKKSTEKRNTIIYQVRGKGWFPMDMLRYDCAWPDDSAALERMTDRVEFYEKAPEFFNTLRTITLCSVKQPTEGRWASFGWEVL